MPERVKFQNKILRIVGLCVLALLVFSVFFYIFKASFGFTGYAITVEDDRVVLYFGYESDRGARVNLLGPDGSVVASTSVGAENNLGRLELANPLKTPLGGTYRLRAERFWKTLNELQIETHGAFISISAIYPEWGWDWLENKATIRGFSFSIKNEGDMPSYVAGVTAYLGSDNIGSDEVGVWLKPGESRSVKMKIWSGPLDAGVRRLILVAEDPEGAGLPGTTMKTFPYFLHGIAFVAVPNFPILSFHAVDEWKGVGKSMYPPPGSPPLWWIVDSWFGKKVNAPTKGWSIYQQISVGAGTS